MCSPFRTEPKPGEMEAPALQCNRPAGTSDVCPTATKGQVLLWLRLL